MSHPGIDVIRSLLGDRATEPQTIQERRDSLEALAGVVPSPDGVTVETLTLAGRPAERSTPDRVDGPGTILYLHGGAYVSGSNTHRALCGRLALATGRSVVALDYRLAPEHRFPAAVDDTVAAAVELASGPDAGPLAIAGDSAGGGLALAALVALRDQGSVRPAAGWLISPWADLTQSGATYDSRVDRDPMLAREGLTEAAGDYLGDGDPTDPLASPMLADLSGLPPVRIDVGDAEVLLDDSVVTGHRIEEAGGAAQVVVWPEMIHVFPAFPSDVVPEAAECLTAAGAFLAHHLATRSQEIAS